MSVEHFCKLTLSLSLDGTLPVWHFDEKISTKPTTITVPAGITLLFQLLYTTHIENDLNEKEHFISSLMM